jgi:Arc/MetJ-type ribon-helix-helix transcriptional regulator
MLSQLPPDVAVRVEALVADGVYPSTDEVLREAIVALDEKLHDAGETGAHVNANASGPKKRKRTPRRDRALEKWLADFTAWANSHKPIGHFVDDSRDSIYE